MASKDYWIERALQKEADAHESTKDTILRLRAIYDTASERLANAAKKIFASYMKASGLIDKQEAERLLTVQETADVLNALKEEYAQTANAEALARLNAQAYAYRISRVQAMRKAIDAETSWIAETETGKGVQQLVKTYDDAYYKTMYDTAKEQETTFSPLPQKEISETLESPWKGANYSQRVWGNTHVLAKEAGEIIDSGITSGMSIQQMTNELKDLFNVASYAAERLIRTEVNRIHNLATLRSYKAMGVDRYTFLATLDFRTCAVCGALDGKHFRVSEAKTGENLPPLHPNDRCTTVAYYPGEEETGTRAAKDPETGKNYKVPAGMTYEKWREEISKKHGADSQENAQKRYGSKQPVKSKCEIESIPDKKSEKKKITFSLPGIGNVYISPECAENVNKQIDDYLSWIKEQKSPYNKLLEFFSKKEKYLVIKFEGPFAYEANNDIILINPEDETFKDYDFNRSLTHETAHRMDALYFKAYLDKKFISSVNKAVAAVNENLKDLETEYLSREEYKNDDFLNDILSALSDNKMVLPVGHDNDYWAQKGNKEKEIFANLFVMSLNPDSISLNFLTKKFPQLYKTFKNIIKWSGY